jgi:parallel beta-helix repeat protein
VALSAGSDGGTPIAACPYVIATPGTYQLVADLVGCAEGIDVTASRVRLRLNGHTITGVSVGRGIFAAAVSHLHIEGPGVIQLFSEGVRFEQVTISSMRSVTSQNNGFGLALNKSFTSGALIPSANDHFQGNQFLNNAVHGVTLNGGERSLFIDNVSSGNKSTGFVLYDASENALINNTANNNLQYGINSGTLSHDEFITHNTALGNVLYDLADDKPGCANEYVEQQYLRDEQPALYPLSRGRER